MTILVNTLSSDINKKLKDIGFITILYNDFVGEKKNIYIWIDFSSGEFLDAKFKEKIVKEFPNIVFCLWNDNEDVECFLQCEYDYYFYENYNPQSWDEIKMKFKVDSSSKEKIYEAMTILRQ